MVIQLKSKSSYAQTPRGGARRGLHRDLLVPLERLRQGLRQGIQEKVQDGHQVPFGGGEEVPKEVRKEAKV